MPEGLFPRLSKSKEFFRIIKVVGNRLVVQHVRLDDGLRTKDESSLRILQDGLEQDGEPQRAEPVTAERRRSKMSDSVLLTSTILLLVFVFLFADQVGVVIVVGSVRVERSRSRSVEGHHGVQDGAQVAQGVEARFVQDPRPERVVQVVAQRLEEPAVRAVRFKSANLND